MFRWQLRSDTTSPELLLLFVADFGITDTPYTRRG